MQAENVSEFFPYQDRQTTGRSNYEVGYFACDK